MNMKKFFTKQRSLPPIIFGVAFPIWVSYYFFTAFSNPRPGIDIDNTIREVGVALADVQIIMEQNQRVQDALARGDESEKNRALEEMGRLQDEFKRKTSAQALISKEREQHRITSLQRFYWERAILWGIMFTVVIIAYLITRQKSRDGVVVSRLKDEETDSVLPKQT